MLINKPWLAWLLNFTRLLLSVDVSVRLCISNFDAKYLGNEAI